jgi:hypothetical protein
MPGQVGQQDLEKLGEFLSTLSSAGAPIDWNDDLMGMLYGVAGLPAPEKQPGRQPEVEPEKELAEKRDRVRKAAPEREQLQAAHDQALKALLQQLADVTAQQIVEVAGQVRQASTIAALATVAPAVAGTAVIADRLAAVFQHGAQTAQQEAAAQGATLPDVDPAAARAHAEQAAETVAASIAQRVGQAASRRALDLARQAGPDADASSFADAVADHLRGLDSVSDELTGAVTRAQNEGRLTAMGAAPDGTVFESSDLSDASTCAPCHTNDGQQYETLAAARLDFPAGQFLGCLGGQRCRCSVIALYPETPGQGEE